VSPESADFMAALITVSSFEPVGLKEVPGPTLIIAPEQFVEIKHINKSREIKKLLGFILIINHYIKLLSYIFYYNCLLILLIKRQVSKLEDFSLESF
jgi:hypothetical protein